MNFFLFACDSPSDPKSVYVEAAGQDNPSAYTENEDGGDEEESSDKMTGESSDNEKETTESVEIDIDLLTFNDPTNGRVRGELPPSSHRTVRTGPYTALHVNQAR